MKQTETANFSRLHKLQDIRAKINNVYQVLSDITEIIYDGDNKMILESYEKIIDNSDIIQFLDGLNLESSCLSYSIVLSKLDEQIKGIEQTLYQSAKELEC